MKRTYFYCTLILNSYIHKYVEDENYKYQSDFETKSAFSDLFVLDQNVECTIYFKNGKRLCQYT